MDPQVELRRRIAEVKPTLGFKPGSPDVLAKWQKQLRARLAAAIGGLAERKCPLSAEVHETREFRTYRRETVRFQSRPGFEVFGYYLAPKPEIPPGPAILCLPGHGTGVDNVVGLTDKGKQREVGENGEYQADFALQCVSKGYRVLAIEQVSFGHRRDAQAARSGGGASSCNRDSMALLMLGDTMTGWRVWDAMRGLDYLAARKDVDPARLATMGISGGGLTSLFTAALDTRVKAAVVSGYFNTWRESILAVDHCVDNYIPGLMKICEMPDLAGLVAPRALFCEAGTKDNIFPLPAFERAVVTARTIYSAFGVQGKFGSEIFEGEHEFHGKGAFEFLAARL